MAAEFPEGKQNTAFKFNTTYARREQLRKAKKKNNIGSYGDLATAMFRGESIEMPPVNPRDSTRYVPVQIFLETEVEAAMARAAQEQNLNMSQFLNLLYFTEIPARKNAAKSKSAGHNVVTYRLSEEALADTEKAVELVYGPNATRHQAMRDVAASWVAATLGKETDNGVIQVHVDADRFEVLKYGALLKYGQEVSLHEAIADIALEAMTAVIENHAEKLADNTIKDS
jgi:hypothetical protein